MLKTLVYYHNDMDGKCCAAIVRKSLGYHKDMEYELIPLVHDDKIELPKNIRDYWRVYILDFTLPEDVMDELLTLFERNNIIWIDHHITAIEKYGVKYGHLEGIRRDGTAACELTWYWVNGQISDIPDTVLYIGDRDIWAMKYGKKTEYFYEWLLSQDTKVSNKVLWDMLLSEKDISEVLVIGEVLRESKLINVKKAVENLGYESEIDGVKCMKVNYSSYDSISDVGHYICDTLDYPVAWIYFYKKNKDNEMIRYSNLRSIKDIDVGAMAASRGGGGHKNASGFIEKV